MATAEELLAQMEENPELYADSIGPVNDVIVINAEERTIELPESERIFGVESDKASERKYFKCPKIVGDNIDLSTLNLFINFKNANNEADIYPIDDVEVNGDYITFSWLLSKKVTAYKTDASKNQLLSFIFCAKNGESPDNEWNTTLCSDGIVLEGLEPGESIAEENPDIIQYILERLDSAGVITPEQISGAVEEYFASNPIQVGATEEQARQIEKNTQDISKLSGEIANLGSGTYSSIEPADDDIPKVFLNGDEFSNMTAEKNEVNMELDYVSKTESFHSFIKIKWQGSSSINYAKKNFTIKMYSDETRDTKLKKLFKDWKVKSYKYVLKANWIDHTHARNIISANLWDEVVSSRSDYDTLPTELKESPKNGAIDGFPVKVYVNGTYQGIYTWNIGKDDWMWGMDEYNPNHVLLCGETNTNGTFRATPCNFRSLWSGTDGTDWSVEVGTNSSSVKNSLNALISCVKDTDDETFKATIGNYLDVQSAIDYYIHQYVICGYDGLGKNILIGTYDLVKWIFGAYDMDSVLGNAWSGGISIPYDYACPEDYQEQFNLLFERIEKLFLSELKARYSELRKTVYSFSNMYSKFEYFMDLIGSELYAEDLEVYSGIKSDTDIKQIRDYIRNRLEYCDSEFSAMVEQVACTGITLNSSALSFTDETAQTLIATVTPGNTTDAILWESNDSSVATVSDGVVTPVANGNCTITATCGNYSASCSVSVSGLFEPIPCTGVTLNETSLTFTGTGTQTLIATVTPDDTTDSLVWSSSDKTKATVVDGVVTAIANGSVTITATCGNYSASCSVNISGIETAPLYTLENGTKTFSDGSVLEITNGNHVKLTKASANVAHVNIARVTQNGDDISSAFTNRVHENIYDFKGKIKRVIIDFMDTCTASGNMSLTYTVASNTGGTYDLASGISIGTDVDKTIASVYKIASMIGFWTNAGKGVIEFDLKLYNDTERVI